MSQKNPNPNIRCRVSSCAYNCGEDACCSLRAIQVEPCEGKNRDSAAPESKADASMCGSYRKD